MWARWEYLADEWALFDRVDWVSVRNTCVLVLLLTPLLSLVIMAVLWLRFWPESQSLVLGPGMLLLTLCPWPIIAAALALSRAHKRLCWLRTTSVLKQSRKQQGGNYLTIHLIERWSGKGSENIIDDAFLGTDILRSQHRPPPHGS